MEAWLESLTQLQRVMLFIAVPATLLLLIQTEMLFIGLGGGDGDADGADLDGDGIPDGDGLDLDGDGIPDGIEEEAVDLDGDGIPDGLHGGIHPDGDAGTDSDAHGGFFSGLHIFTIRGFITFFTLFGWSGLLFLTLGLHWLLSLFLAVQIGIIGMVAVAVILREAMRLQSDGTLDVRNALGERGSVDLTVPARGQGTGKVNVTVQEQLREFEAVTEQSDPIPTGSEIIVTGLAEDGVLIVSPVASEREEV